MASRCLELLDLALKAQKLKQADLSSLFISVQTILGRFLEKHPSVELVFLIISYIWLLPERCCSCFCTCAALMLPARLRQLMFLQPNLCQNVLRGLSGQMSCSATVLQGYLCLTGGSNELISAAIFSYPKCS